MHIVFILVDLICIAYAPPISGNHDSLIESLFDKAQTNSRQDRKNYAILGAVVAIMATVSLSVFVALLWYRKRFKKLVKQVDTAKAEGYFNRQIQRPPKNKKNTSRTTGSGKAKSVSSSTSNKETVPKFVIPALKQVARPHQGLKEKIVGRMKPVAKLENQSYPNEQPKSKLLPRDLIEMLRSKLQKTPSIDLSTGNKSGETTNVHVTPQPNESKSLQSPEIKHLERNQNESDQSTTEETQEFSDSSFASNYEGTKSKFDEYLSKQSPKLPAIRPATADSPDTNAIIVNRDPAICKELPLATSTPVQPSKDTRTKTGSTLNVTSKGNATLQSQPTTLGQVWYPSNHSENPFEPNDNRKDDCKATLAMIDSENELGQVDLFTPRKVISCDSYDPTTHDLSPSDEITKSRDQSVKQKVNWHNQSFPNIKSVSHMTSKQIAHVMDGFKHRKKTRFFSADPAVPKDDKNESVFTQNPNRPNQGNRLQPGGSKQNMKINGMEPILHRASDIIKKCDMKTCIAQTPTANYFKKITDKFGKKKVQQTDLTLAEYQKAPTGFPSYTASEFQERN